MLSLFVLLFLITVNHSQETFDPTSHENWPLLKNQNCEDNPTSRIVGGTDAKLGEFPWIARLLQNGFWSGCGGSIVNKRTIVTAAHCVYDENEREGKLTKQTDAVALGDWNRMSDPDCDERICAEKIQTISVDEIIIPTKYLSNYSIDYDIALLRLAKDIQFNSYISPICMPKGHLMQNNISGGDAIAAGWGVKDSATDEASQILRKVTLKVRDSSFCEHVLYFKREHDICAGGEENMDICLGDSGGPLMSVEENNGRPRTFLIGIVSAGTRTGKCGVKDFPSIFTRVSAFMSWILDNLVENKVQYYKVE